MPETLGNTELVLPVGVVCDTCNNRCARLDKALAEFSPVRLNKTLAGVRSKKGKLPEVKFKNGYARATTNDHIEVVVDGDIFRRPSPDRPGHTRSRFDAQFADWTPKVAARVQRALVKQALELCWLELDEETALSADFDRERSIILRGNHRGFLALVRRVSNPDINSIRLRIDRFRRVEDDHPLIELSASFGGVTILTNTLLERPQFEQPDELLVMTF